MDVKKVFETYQFFRYLAMYYFHSKFSQVISMNDYAVAKILLNTLIHECGDFTSEDDFDNLEKLKLDRQGCGGFLCNSGACNPRQKVTPAISLYSLMYILTCIAQDSGHVIVPALKQNHKWASHLDRQQVFLKV